MAKGMYKETPIENRFVKFQKALEELNIPELYLRIREDQTETVKQIKELNKKMELVLGYLEYLSLPLWKRIFINFKV